MSLVILGAGYSWGVAETRPFTTGADIVVAVGFALVAAAAAISLRRRRTDPRLLVAGGGSIAPWVGVIGFLAVVELVAYFAGFSGGRQNYPTLSSLYDSASASVPVKALVAFGWIAMGWGLFGPPLGDPRSRS